MRFTTGSPMLVVKEIKVIFHTNVGMPFISAHTCGAVIDLA